MTVLSWTVPLEAVDGRTDVELNRESLLASMRDKAENPAAYIPYITSCDVRERYSDGILREILYSSGERVVERVTYGANGRFVFEVTEPLDVARVVNQVSESGSGFLFTLEVTLSESGNKKAMREPGFLEETSALFAGSLLTIAHATVEHCTTVK
ncbi:hypothetical protein FHR84_003332 [Actinopolyspora biskrensis]|uniref:Polyketide cyclase / dehydrase and lipid transport n=1 Tax=Actinopolyspora biskrensis TaxID=1470178 RepID=A0A852ZDB0_9ACTN|nr:AtaL-like protein [Actinopolyspora biskrensis]NYH79983.1 hypothetical protein [Actinopolyspora biskrensis]